MSTPQEILDLARDVLRRPDTAGVWPRAVALLARQALETFLDDVWQWKALDFTNVSTRAQLACLPTYIDPRIAARISHTWWALSRACHHHPYELPPTATELTSLLDEIEAIFTGTATAAARG